MRHTRHITLGGPDTGNTDLTLAVLHNLAQRDADRQRRINRRARLMTSVKVALLIPVAFIIAIPLAAVAAAFTPDDET